MGSIQVSGRNLSGVSYQASTGEIAISGTADVVLQGTGQEAQTLRLTGSGTVTLRSVSAPLLTVDGSGVQLAGAGENTLQTVRLRPGAVLTLDGGGFLRMGSLEAAPTALLRLRPGAAAEVRRGEDSMGGTRIPVILEGPASLAVQADRVSDPRGRSLDPVDVIWKALLPGWSAVTAMAVDGTWSSVTVGGIRPDRKFCVNADKLSSRKEEQLRGFFGQDTARLNSAYPPVFRGEKRYARAA